VSLHDRISGWDSHGVSTHRPTAWDIGKPRKPKRASFAVLCATRIADTTSYSQPFETEITSSLLTNTTGQRSRRFGENPKAPADNGNLVR